MYIDCPTIVDIRSENCKNKKGFSAVASLVRIHLISMLEMGELFRSTNRGYEIQIVEPPQQLKLMR